MATTIPSAALVPVTPVFTNTERPALAGFLAGYSGLPRPGRAPAVRRQLARHRLARVRPGRQANPSQGARPDQDRGAGQGSGICTPTSRRASAKPQAMIVQQAGGWFPMCPQRSEAGGRVGKSRG